MDAPDYESEEYSGIRQDLAHALNMTEQEAAEHLASVWRQRNPRQGRHDPPPHQPRDPSPPAQAQREPEDEPQPDLPPAAVEERKNAPKIIMDRGIPAVRLSDPSEHALRKLRNFEYVELWYFTPKGCEAAASHAVSLDADTFTIAKSDSNLTLLPTRSTSMPKNSIIQDQHLSFSDMGTAKNNLITHMQRCGWPDGVVTSFMKFYTLLDTHPIRSQPQGEQAILMYQAEVRRDWHRELAASRDHRVFNLARVCNGRLQIIVDSIRIDLHNQLIRDLTAAKAQPLQGSSRRSRHRKAHSRSRSPPRRGKRKRSPSPSSDDSSDKPRRRKPFRAPQPSSRTNLLSVCPTCLGRHPHDVANCRAPLKWDGSEANRCTRNSKGHLQDPDGATLCTDWQKPRGCSDTTTAHASRHQCSGCGGRDHGAQTCSRAQKR